MKKIFKELFELFVKSNKREPNAIEMLQLKFKASQKASQQVGKGELSHFLLKELQTGLKHDLNLLK
jgi:hypothetical protein